MPLPKNTSSFSANAARRRNISPARARRFAASADEVAAPSAGPSNRIRPGKSLAQAVFSNQTPCVGSHGVKSAGPAPRRRLPQRVCQWNPRSASVAPASTVVITGQYRGLQRGQDLAAATLPWSSPPPAHHKPPRAFPDAGNRDQVCNRIRPRTRFAIGWPGVAAEISGSALRAGR